MAAVEKAGVEPPYWPRIAMQARGTRVRWRPDRRAVLVPSWEDAPPGLRALLDPAGGRTTFGLVYHWLLPAGALARMLLDEFGWSPSPATTNAARELAVAFLATRPGGPGRLHRIRTRLQALGRLPPPDDAGWDAWNRALVHRSPDGFGQQLRRLVGHRRLPAAVVLGPSRDAGFHLAALLDVPAPAASFFEPAYEREVEAAREQLGIPDLLLRSGAPPGSPARSLARRLAAAPRMLGLVRVPALFRRFDDSRAAFAWILQTPAAATLRPRVPARVRGCLPRLAADRGAYTPEERRLGRDLATFIRYELESFHSVQYHFHRPKWDWLRRRFRDRWYQLVAADTLSVPDEMRQVVIVLTPALRHRCVLYPVHAGVARMALGLPETPAGMDRALRAAFEGLERIARGEIQGSLCRPGE